MAARRIGHDMRLYPAGFVKAGRGNRNQIRHRDKGQIDGCPAGRAESMDLFIPAIAGNAPVIRWARNFHIGSPGKAQVRSVPRAASLLAIAALAMVLEDGFIVGFISNRAAGTSAGIWFVHIAFLLFAARHFQAGSTDPLAALLLCSTIWFHPSRWE